VDRLGIAATRRALEGTFGLALDGLSEEQVADAVRGAAAEGCSHPADPAFLGRVVDRLPIDESWLFREDGLWSWLEASVLPEALDRAAREGRPVRVLSLGCSSGPEPFSAAILLLSLLEARGLPSAAAPAYAQVLGVDPSRARVEAARSGILGAWAVERARPAALRGLVAPDAVPGRYRVAPPARALCRFETGNLVDMASAGSVALAGFDLVLCRNVLIYFKPEEAARIAGALARALDPGAVLVFSAAEAHLVDAAGTLAPLDHLGAGRAVEAASAAPPQRARRRPRPARPARLAHPSRPGLAARPAAALPSGSDGVAAQVRVALEHAHAGRAPEALCAARAAVERDPRDLYARLLLGQQLLAVDGAAARRVLRDLLQLAAALPQDAAVPCAEGLSVGQLGRAVALLLDRGDRR
jgi:chemotaxis methyl-accepting protein methylase